MGNIASILEAFDLAIRTANLLQTTLQAAKENAEMTPEQETAFDAHVAERMAGPHWHGRNPD